ncbi:MAG: hypothetical protein QM704_12660 [Anaeromyxobacteraceae bacterium]
MRPLPRCAAALLLAASACSTKLELPDGADVTCTRSGDCPAGYTCVLEASRCVRSDASFDVAKVVAASVAITPALPRARGAKATLAFTLDRGVKATPAVRLAWLGGDAPAALETKGADGRSFTFGYTVGSAEPEGSLTLVIDTVSDAGVPSRFEKTQAVQLDFTPPALAPDTLSTGFAVPPGVKDVVGSVSALGPGGEATVHFAVTEALDGGATLELEPAEALGQACDAPVGTFFTCHVPLTAPPAAQGAHGLFARVTDPAGNEARLSLGSITIDTVAPAPPDVVTAGRILYSRVPWGADATSGVRSFSLTGGAGAVEAGARLVVFDGATLANASRIGGGQADGSGAVPTFDLVPADRARVYVAAVDGAGNVSDADGALAGAQAVQVRDVAWTATLAGKTALDAFTNPHRLRGLGILADGVLARSSAERSDTGTLGRRDGVGLAVEGAGTWTRIDPLGTPPDANYLSYTDTWRGQLRGLVIGIAGVQTWLATGTGWLEEPVVDPEFDGNPALAENGVAFDAQRGEVVLAGSGSQSGDTWVFANQSWRFVPGSGAPRVDGGTMVYDDNLGKVLLFGGLGASGPTAATWAFDGSTWEQVASTGPQPRSGAYAFFDRALGKVVLFGGSRVLTGGATDCGGGLSTTPNGPCLYRDTWLWDGQAWTRACDSTTADCGVEPTSRQLATAAYDPVRKRGVFFGGGYGPDCVTASTEICQDLYEWNGSAWSKPTPADPTADGSAPGRVTAIFGWEPIRGRLLVAGGEDEFQGCGGAGLCRRTWWWDGSDWQLVADHTRAAPFVHGLTVFSFDAARGELVFANGDFTDTTWSFNGRFWTSFATGNPPAANYPSSAGTPNGVYRFGGVMAGTSNPFVDGYRRTGTTWSVLTTSTPKPSPRYQSGTTWNGGAAIPHLLVFGGGYSQPTGPCPAGNTSSLCLLNDTWGYGAWGAGVCGAAGTSCWRNLGTGGPPPRYFGPLVAMANGEAIVFGGSGSGATLGDTWRWNGTAWTQVTGAGPSARTSPVAAFDARRGKVLLASGNSPFAPDCGAAATGLACPDVWEFDGTAWRRRVVADPENDGSLASGDGVGAYSTDGGVYAPGGGSGRLWRWDGGFALRPAVAAELDFSAAGAPPASTIEAVTAAATVRAASQLPGGAATADAQLLVGEPLGWRTVATGASGGAGGASLGYCASRVAAAGCEVRRAGQLLLGRSGTIVLAAVPAGQNGTGIATVALDYLEVKVRYRMPDPAEE